MRRDIFDAEHESFRRTTRAFIERHITPNHARWERDGVVSRDVWLEAGKAGLLGIDIDQRYGGGGESDFRYYLVLNEELARAGAHGPGFQIHNDILGHYLSGPTTDEQRARWLPGYCSGELIGAIALTEPEAGSDLRAVRTRAVRDADGFLLNGHKTFISNGQLCDLVVVLARTDDKGGFGDLSLFAVERGMPGFERGRNLEKIGMPAQDTSELFFTDVRVPAGNLIGRLGGGLAALLSNLPRERLSIAASALAGAESVFEQTLSHCKTRQAFGQAIGSFQYNRFMLAEMATELSLARVFTDRAALELNANRLSAEEAAMAKWWNTELCKRVVDRCLQLHGGHGYMRDSGVGRAFVDARVQTIYGGSTEILKETIGRGLGV